MTRDYIHKRHVKVLGILSVLFLIASIYFYRQDSFVIFRGLRGVICFAFLALMYFFQQKSVNWVVAVFLLLYGSSSIATIWYDNPNIANISMGLNFAAFMVLIGALSPKINFKKMNGFFASIFVVLILINGYLFYMFIEMIRDFALNDFHFFLIFLGAMSLILSTLFCLLYNHEISSKTSLLFTLFVFILVFAEVFRVIALYEFAYGNYSVYIARALVLLGISLLVHYELTEKKPSEVLGKK